jgi:hypothetical protein
LIENVALAGGWDEAISFDEQVEIRISAAVIAAQHFISVAQQRHDNPLTPVEIASALRRGAADSGAGAVDVSRLAIVQDPVLDGLGGEVTFLESTMLWAMALQYASSRLLDEVYKLELPTFVMGRGVAHYHAERGVIVLPQKYTAADVMLGTQQVIDGIGRTRAAAERVREQDSLPGKKLKTTFGLEALPGRWIDPADGIVDEACVPYLDAAAARFSGAQDESLSAMWTACPRQVGLYIATMSGAWV